MRFIVVMILFAGFVATSAQQSADDYIMKGIKEHDKGNYEEALEYYDKAIETGEMLGMAYYEKGYTYSTMGNHQKCLEMASLTIEHAESDELLGFGYMLKANSLDYLDQPEEAVDVYLEGIDETEFFMLDFNLGITYRRLMKDSLSLLCFANTIKKNLIFPSSHYYLSINYYETKQKSKSIISSLFFLALPNSKEDRKVMVYENLLSSLDVGVEKTSDTSYVINSFFSINNSAKFNAIDLMISLNSIDLDSTKKDLSKHEKIVDNITTIISMFEDWDDDDFDHEIEEFLYEYYVEYLLDVKENGYLETMVHIASSTNEVESQQWVIDNTDKVKEYYMYFGDYFDLE
jgi:tetratricopeptide (TPR) repeat protein